MRSGKGCAPAAALPGRPGVRREWSLRIRAHDERLSARCGRGAAERRRRPSRRAWREGPPSWRRHWRVSLGQRRSSSPLAGARTLKSRKERYLRYRRREAEFMSYRAVKARCSHEALRRRFAPDGRAIPACLEVKKAIMPLVGCDVDFLGHRPEPPHRADACEGARGPNFRGCDSLRSRLAASEGRWRPILLPHMPRRLRISRFSMFSTQISMPVPSCRVLAVV